MMQLHQDYNKFVENNTVIAVIGPEKADSFKLIGKKIILNSTEFLIQNSLC